MNQSEWPVVRLFEGGFTRKGFSLLGLDQATPLRVSLLNEIAFHLRNCITSGFPLAIKDGPMV